MNDDARLDDAPWGAHAPSPSLALARRAALATRDVPLLGRWVYKILTHVTRRRGLVVDLEYAGLKWRLRLDENSHDRWIFRRGEHPEEPDFEIFSAYRGRETVFVDIGANVGHFSLTAYRALGPGSRILAFEPHPRTRAKLRANLRFNGAEAAVEVAPLALGAERAMLMLHEPYPGSDGGNTLAVAQSAAGGRSVPVEVAPLAEVLAERGVTRIDILKIDVEGYEDRVLLPFFETAPPTLWPREMLVETTFGAGHAQWIEDPIVRLKALGYVEKARTRDNLWLVRG